MMEDERLELYFEEGFFKNIIRKYFEYIGLRLHSVIERIIMIIIIIIIKLVKIHSC